MTPDSAPSWRREPPRAHDNTPASLARLGRLEVRAQRIVEGFFTGRHASPYLGRSLEFREHRQYVRGDDLRHVDWKVWGRQDRLYVKQFEEETNLRATLLVDRSASMAYQAAGRPAKHEHAALAACVLAGLLLRQHDAVGCMAFADRVLSAAPHRANRIHLSAIADALDQGAAPPGAEARTDLAGALEHAAATMPGRGLAVLVSDLLSPVDGLERGLALLRARGADLVVLQVLDDDEIEFPFEGPTRFEGLEGGARLDANPRALRKGYLAALERHQSQVREACARQRADYALMRTGERIDAALLPLLARRQGGRRPSRSR
ncbi:MAG: DUF58 domain-containing protein [Lacipirellulaceae bacterium]